MAYKTFVNGFPLNASELNTFLMNQSVATFANAAARTAAITAPAEGQLTYLEDDNTFYAWNGSSWVAQNFEAPRSPNYVINGAFDIWQRGTSFDVVYFNSGNQNHSDRWQQNWDNAPTAVTVSRQTFTPGELTVAGFGEEEFYYSSSIGKVGPNTNWRLTTRIEDVRTLAGQTATVSFWAKTDSARNIIVELTQNFGTGGSTQLNFSPTTVAATTTWQRFSVTVNVPSITGKTIGANNHLRVNIRQASASGSVMDVWGVQLEAGSVATPFRRNANSLQGELAACQRYFVALGGQTNWGHSLGYAASTTSIRAMIPIPVTMRATPTLVDATPVIRTGTSGLTPSATTMQSTQASAGIQVSYTVTGATANNPAIINHDATASLSAEL
jgi:hypothetical protein